MQPEANPCSSERLPTAAPPVLNQVRPWRTYGGLASEHTYLLPGGKGHQPSSAKRDYHRLLYLLCFSLMACLIVIGWKPGDDALNPVVRNRIRREWEQEMREHEVARKGWKEERQELDEQWAKLIRDRETWVHECEAGKREEERQRKEAEDRMRAAFAWGGLAPDQRCLRWSTRQYTARIANVPRDYDPVRACMETEVDIHGVKMASPQWCEDRGCNGVIGHWTVDSGESSCEPHFDYFEDKGCKGSGLRRIISHLEDLHGEDDWHDMCSSTPADVNGMHFYGPHKCENWKKYGTWGIWDIEDRNCN